MGPCLTSFFASFPSPFSPLLLLLPSSLIEKFSFFPFPSHLFSSLLFSFLSRLVSSPLVSSPSIIQYCRHYNLMGLFFREGKGRKGKGREGKVGGFRNLVDVLFRFARDRKGTGKGKGKEWKGKGKGKGKGKKTLSNTRWAARRWEGGIEGLEGVEGE